ncbi:MAG: bifunctional folylpolyglutamate synthase/dihydrofolate synthase [Chloroflexi bacterium]|nr:MAG: bifunctional folylpolyglutamate synthase/dihydrofolate synthase [Chloroflexota bacterium]
MNEVDNSYQAALDYLYSFVDYSLTHSSRYAQANFELGRMEAFLRLLGDPHRQYPVIHIAGTKGKGSTAALIASCLSAAGNRVGLYTSPHLQEYTERIQVNGRQIALVELVELVDWIKPYVAQVDHLTTFEITTALGFLYFARQKVEVAVVEVGLGGRLDATNVVTPLVSVITSLSMDHIAVLGDTLGKIAYEKAGIIKPGRPVVLSPQADEARQVIAQAAAERGCPLHEVGREYQVKPVRHSLQGQVFWAWKTGEVPGEFYTPLLGHHQVENAATAFAALRVAREEGLSITEGDIRSGFAGVSWPGRFEVLRLDPPVVVDSAHNRDSARRLRQALDDYLPDKPVVIIFGASEDKDIGGMLSELAPRISAVVATQSIHPRAMPAARLVEIAQDFHLPAQAVVPVEKALPAALHLAGKKSVQQEPAVVLAAGSLFVAAAVREIWKKQEAIEV